MQCNLNKCFFVPTLFLLILCSGVATRAEAAKNTNTGVAAPVSAAANKDMVAMVNGTAITRKQYDNAMDYQIEMAAMNGVTLSTAQLSDLKYQMLESLIDEELLYQESLKSGIKIESTEIEDAYEARKEKAQVKTDADFEEKLKESNKSIASYRTEIERGLAIDRLIKNKITDNAVVPDSEAKQYYDDNIRAFQVPAQFRVSHIMIRVSPDADQSVKDEATQKLDRAIKRVKDGEEFAAVAKEVSEDSNSKDKDGDLGYIALGPFEESFEDAVSALEKDEISGIVKTRAGYHILKLTDKAEARTISFEEAKTDIISRLKSSKVNGMVSSYIKGLKIRSTIMTYPIIR